MKLNTLNRLRIAKRRVIIRAKTGMRMRPRGILKLGKKEFLYFVSDNLLEECSRSLAHPVQLQKLVTGEVGRVTGFSYIEGE